MSRFLFITLEGCSPDCCRVEALVSGTERRCVGSQAAKMARQLRLVLRQETFGVSIEAFIGSAAVLELLSIKSKRALAIDVLSALVKECQNLVRHVGIVCVRAEHENSAQWPVPKSGIDLERALQSFRREDSWVKLRTSMNVFHFPRVEARLKRSLSVGVADRVAKNYFREYEVRADTLDRAVELIRNDIVEDGAELIDAGPIQFGDSESRLSDCEDLTDGILLKGGRVFFSD